MISKSIVLWVVLVIGTILVSVQIGLRAEGLEDAVRTVQRAQIAEQDRIRTLRASYAYLTSADQLQPLAERHLALEPIRGDQITTLAELPRRIPVPLPRGQQRREETPSARSTVPPPAVSVPDSSRSAEAPSEERNDAAPPRSRNTPPWLKAQQNKRLQPVSLPGQKRSSL